MSDTSNRTFVCSILFLDIVEYSKRSVAEQMHQKQRFNALLEKALETVAVSDRVVLDTGDGAAISFLGNPEDALNVAMTLRNAIQDSASPLDVRFGVNLGPVRLIKDLNGQLNIIGDGINVAERVMSFSSAGQLLVSRSYYEVVSRLDPQFERLFRYEGSRTDKHVREHEVYAVGAGNPIRAMPPEAPAVSQPPTIPMKLVPPRAAATPARAPRRFDRRLTIGLPVLMVAIVAAGISIRTLRSTDASTAIQPPADAKAPRTSGAARREAVRKDAQRQAADAVQSGNAAATLLIVPWGEIYVDGKPRGVSPPLRVLELSPGNHKVEIRNGVLPPHTEQVTVHPGEKLTIRHRFN